MQMLRNIIFIYITKYYNTQLCFKAFRLAHWPRQIACHPRS